jgi:cysteine desulfurase
MNALYLDHAATTPCRREAWDAMFLNDRMDFGNPNSLHSFGRRARQASTEARERIAACLGASGSEIVPTGSGTESNNLAIRGAVLANRSLGRHIVTTKVEHPSTLRLCSLLQKEGFEVTYLDVDEYGRVTPEQVAGAVRGDTVLVSIGHANNEIGTIQPIEEIAHAVKRVRPEVLVHSDAVQTMGYLPIDLGRCPVDLLTFAAYKFYGPKGVGGLYVRKGIRVQPLMVGGDERRLHPGTESVPQVVGMAVALELAYAERESESAYWTPIRDRVIQGLLSSIEESRLNGHPTERLATNVNVSFAGISGEDLVLMLDRVGICTSTGSACTTGKVDPSHVLLALGMSRQYALGGLRLTFGHACHDLDPGQLVSQIGELVEELRSTSYRPRRRALEPTVVE